MTRLPDNLTWTTENLHRHSEHSLPSTPMSCCSHPCRVQYGLQPQGLFFNQGLPGANLNHAIHVSMNPGPFPANCADLFGGKGGMQQGMHMLSPAQPGIYKIPTPCPVPRAEPCEAKSSKICVSPCVNPTPESCNDKGAKRHASLGTKPMPESDSNKNLPPAPAERCHPPPPPRYIPPRVSGCPPPDGPKFRGLSGFPASSRCYPPREKYHYTTSKTYKLCYAK